MYHSITIGDRNTWDDWHLIAKSRPFFAPPKPKTKTIEVPGANGSIDVSTILTGYPLFDNREGSIEFMILNVQDIDDDDYEYKNVRWIDEYTDIMNYLNGRKLRAVLEDEPEYYYEGRFSVTGYKPGDSASNPRATITISYTLDPYKWHKQTTSEEWVWDTFNFLNGVVYPDIFTNISVSGVTIKKSYSFRENGYAPIKPVITCTVESGNELSVQLTNNTLSHTVSFTTNESKVVDDLEFIMYGDVDLILSGNGTVSVDFRPGRL